MSLGPKWWYDFMLKYDDKLYETLTNKKLITMSNFNQHWCSVIYENGMHMVITPNGSKIPGVITTITNDSTGTSPQCTLTIHCNIGKDLEDTINKYQQNN